MVYLLYITAFLNVFLGLFTFANKPKTRINLYFFLFTICIGGWAVTNALFQEAPSEHIMYFWAIVAYQVTTVMLIMIQRFTVAITEYRGETTSSKLLSILIFLFGTLGPLVPGLITSGVNFKTRAIIGGPCLPLLFGTYLYLIIHSLLRLKTSLNTAKDVKRKQLLYVFWGLLGAIIAGVTTNLILPSFQIYTAVAIGPTFTLIFLTLIAYAILRYRLFDIRILVGRITYHVLVGTLPFIAFFALVFIYEQLFGTVFTLSVYLISILVAIGFVVIFNRLNSYIRSEVSTRLINPGYDPAETVEQLANTLSLVIDFPHISKEVLSTCKRTIRPDYSGLVVFANTEQLKVDQKAFSDEENRDIEKLKDIAQLIWQNAGRHPIVFDDIEIEIREGQYKNIENLVKDIKSFMEQIGAKIVIPLGTRETVIGMFLIGQKEADSPYTVRDISFLESVATAGSTAIARSLLYHEVQEFANTLQGKVDKATEELQKTNTSLEQALSQIQEVRRRERDMIDVMGHELRTPITIVRNALSMMQRSFKKNEGEIPKDILEKYLDMGTESTKREIHLIETLLTATKVDASRLQFDLVQVDFKDVVNDSLEGNRGMLEQKKLQPIYIPPKDDIFVFADRTRSQEIMDNFLSNAAKYTLKGKIEIDIWDDSNFGWISIKDSGIGIDEGDLKNLGKKFFRAKQYVPNNKKNGNKAQIVRPGGTGLGLYVSFELIRMMGGELYINSVVGEGSTFTFSLPIYKKQERKQIDQTFEQDLEKGRKHVHINKEAPKASK